MPNPNMAARSPDHLALVEDGVQEVSETIGAKVEMKDPLCAALRPEPGGVAVIMA